MFDGCALNHAGSTVNVTGKDINVSVGNNKAENIEHLNQIDTQAWNGDSEGLYKFCEESFSDLKMLKNARFDDFGCPANTWTYK